MTNQQMQENFGIVKYDMINIVKTPENNNVMLNTVQSLVSGVPNCIVKDYSVEVKTQALYLKQKMVLVYGMAAIILIIGLFHILNSMSYLVISRKHEFGIMRLCESPIISFIN